MKIAEHVAMLKISANIMGTASAIYPALLFDGDNLILVDTGFPGQLDAVREAIAQEGETFDRLNGIILTHQDIDHIGNLASICDAHPGKVTVFANAAEKPFITGEKTPLKLAHLEANYQSLPEQMRTIYQKLKAGFQSSFAGVQSTLSDEQVLPYCGGIEIIATPGHTTGHICLYLRESKTLIAGDAVAVENGSLVATPASLNYSESEYRESLKNSVGMKSSAYFAITAACTRVALPASWLSYPQNNSADARSCAPRRLRFRFNLSLLDIGRMIFPPNNVAISL